jgi:MFS family permease
MATKAESIQGAAGKTRLRDLPRNVWAVGITSFFMDISSEMVINLVPLYLLGVLGVSAGIIGIIEGVADWTASFLKLFSGWLSDKARERKWLAVLGYAMSAASKPFFYFAGSWVGIAGARWADRVGKGVRTAPRDALLADSVRPDQRGVAFGLHRAMDTAGAMVGLIIALLVVLLLQATDTHLEQHTFQVLVLISLVPAVIAVLSLAIGAKDVPVLKQRAAPKFAFKSLGRPFIIFMVIVTVFALGNSSDAFLTLRAQERGLSLAGILAMLITFNLIYTLVSTPAGSLSDRVGRRKVIVAGWLAYAVIYTGFGLVQTAGQVWVLYALYGLYYGMAFGTASALIADIVPADVRGTAYGTYNAAISVGTLFASIVAGLLWQNVSPAAPFLFGGVLALVAAALMQFWMPKVVPTSQNG